MGFEEGIFEQFFKKLEQDEEFPNSVLERIKEARRSGEELSRDTILHIIKGEREDGRET